MTWRYLALGDSYTIGEGVAVSERWPVQLAVALRAAGVSLSDPRIIAKTGWTTAELLAALDDTVPPLGTDYDLVSLLIGVNDQYRGLGVRSFRENFLELLTRAVRYARGEAGRVIVVSIPDWGVTPFAGADPRGTARIAAEIDQFNAVTCDEARRIGAEFVDVTAGSRQAAHDRTLLAADLLHPSGRMYEQWVRAMATFVVGILSS